MKHYLISALIALVVVAIVFRIPAVKSVVTGS
jgi:hypothetical protein